MYSFQFYQFCRIRKWICAGCQHHWKATVAAALFRFCALNLFQARGPPNNMWHVLTYSITSVNMCSSGASRSVSWGRFCSPQRSHHARLEPRCETRSRPGPWCQRRRTPAKTRPGIRDALPSKACGFNREQMWRSGLCDVYHLFPRNLFFFCTSLKKKVMGNQNQIRLNIQPLIRLLLIWAFFFSQQSESARSDGLLHCCVTSSIVTRWHQKKGLCST